ncbi:hypothetical protein H1230_15075 [Paenibacillus sp. 19GGS1-52]|uniref:hypothetical protein n=1 Tax=Paenibacillus sp. 19GGS1-52 TaxID=2758563 RepID=UPI001EFB8867|nr:hypothetical protein [Paenibacillus sp. 19GGS1-52]ULO09970.1 hypothetical protein H1230_15075 [Paenibacillus sp. 19GGS1-52]
MNDKDSVYLAHFLFPDCAMNENVMEQLRTATAAERMCRLRYSEGEHVQDVCLQVHKDRILLISNQKVGAISFEQIEPAAVEQTCLQLFNIIEPLELGYPLVPALMMSKHKYEELKESSVSSSLHSLSQSLFAETGEYEHSAQLARVMKYYCTEGELRLCSRSGSGWKVHYAAFIGDFSCGWLLRMNYSAAEDWMIAFPLNKSQLCNTFTEWVRQPTSIL